jgi:hypothetical protein
VGCTKGERYLDRSFWAVFLTITVIGTTTWLAIFERNYHPRIYRYTKEVMILEIGDSELDFNHPEGAFSIWWQSGRRKGELGTRGGEMECRLWEFQLF